MIEVKESTVSSTTNRPRRPFPLARLFPQALMKIKANPTQSKSETQTSLIVTDEEKKKWNEYFITEMNEIKKETEEMNTGEFILFYFIITIIKKYLKKYK